MVIMAWTNIPVLLLIYGFPVSANLYVNHMNTLWDYTNPPCKLASPVITYSKNGPVIEIPSDVRINPREMVLVGYTQSFETFEYIGCVWVGHVQNKQWIPVLADPGQCFSACQTTFFGIYGNECYCLNDEPRNIPNTYIQCSEECSFPHNTVCGGHRYIGYPYISVYKQVSTSDKGLNDGKHCRMYKHQSRSFAWNNCNVQLRGLCQSGVTDSHFETTGNSQYFKRRWSGYPFFCFFNQQYPASEKIDRIGNIGATDFWIGRIKSRVIVDATRALSDHLRYGYYGYVSQNGFLYFTKETTGSVLCMTATTTAEVNVSALSTTMTTTNTKITESTTPFSTMASVTMKGETFDMVTQQNRDSHTKGNRDANGSSVPIAVYVIIPVVLVVAVAVVALIIRRKRNHANDQSAPDVVYSSRIQQLPPNGNSDNAVLNVTYSDAYDIATPKGDSACDPFYANANNSAKPSMKTDNKVHRTPLSGLSCKANAIYNCTGNTIVGKGQEHDYFVLENPGAAPEITVPQNTDGETYNTTNAVPRVDAKLHGNIYNRLSDFSEDTYNHSGNKDDHVYDATNLQEKGKVTDNVYNVFSKDDDSDNLYNTTDGDSRSQGQCFEDTYSHMK